MRVVLIADRRFATREQAMLARLRVGLADEGVRVVQALPEGFDAGGEASMFTETVRFEEIGLPLSLSWRAAATARQLAAPAKGGDVDGPQVVHAFGGPAWGVANALAERLDAALILEIWRDGLRHAVHKVAAQGGRGSRLVALCPTEGLAERLAAEGPEVSVRSAPWGVYTDQPKRSVLRPGRAWSIMLAGSGMDRAAFCACFEALSDVIRTRPDTLLFADALAARRTELWQLAARLGVRERLSLVDEMDANRDLVLRGDVLVLPEARGEQRTLTLEAMVAGMPVVALADPGNTSLIDRRSALLVGGPERSLWEQHLGSLLADPELQAQLTESARAYVAAEHRPSRQVNGVIDAYEAAVGRQPIPFPGS